MQAKLCSFKAPSLSPFTHTQFSVDFCEKKLPSSAHAVYQSIITSPSMCVVVLTFSLFLLPQKWKNNYYYNIQAAIFLNCTVIHIFTFRLLFACLLTPSLNASLSLFNVAFGAFRLATLSWQYSPADLLCYIAAVLQLCCLGTAMRYFFEPKLQQWLVGVCCTDCGRRGGSGSKCSNAFLYAFSLSSLVLATCSLVHIL